MHRKEAMKGSEIKGIEKMKWELKLNNGFDILTLNSKYFLFF